MKRIIILLTGIVLFIPCVINAKINFTKEESVGKTANWITNYKDSKKYIIQRDDFPFGYKESAGKGVIFIDPVYKKSGLLNSYEYSISGGDGSYLFDGGSYWTMTNNNSLNTFNISFNGINALSNSSNSGIRYTDYIISQVLIDGSGTYSDPWYFTGLKSSTLSFHLGSVGGQFPDYISGMDGPFALKRTMEYGDTLSIPTPYSSDYTFVNWSIQPSNSNYVGNIFTMGESDVSFTANWEPTTYKLTIDLGSHGGYFTDLSYPLEQKITPYGSVSVPNPISEDYNFSGWRLTSNNNDASLAGTSTVRIGKSAAQLTAQWTKKTYNLAFALGSGGEFSDANTRSGITLGRTDIYTITNTPIRKGYKFNGWYVSSGNATVNGNVVTMGNQASTIAANWTEMIYNFDYVGSSRPFQAPVAGYYQLEVWGAQGKTNETAVYRGHYFTGGYGGYSVGAVWLNANQTIYVTVGSSGNCSESYYADGTKSGGYNGGGSVVQPVSSCGDCINCTGGGATHIATSSGTLNSFSSNYTSRVFIVAGGGGGTHRHWNAQNSGGPGGGYLGRSGIIVFNQYNNCTAPTGGNQSKGGTGYNYSGRSGSFGLGGNVVAQVNSAGGSGGGGLFGGGSGGHGDSCANAGAGGSGYIGNSLLVSRYTNLTLNKVVKTMYCYGCSGNGNASVYTVSTNRVSSTPTSNSAKSYNGYARISYLSAE